MKRKCFLLLRIYNVANVMTFAYRTWKCLPCDRKQRNSQSFFHSYGKAIHWLLLLSIVRKVFSRFLAKCQYQGRGNQMCMCAHMYIRAFSLYLTPAQSCQISNAITRSDMIFISIIPLFLSLLSRILKLAKLVRINHRCVLQRLKSDSYTLARDLYQSSSTASQIPFICLPL